MTAIVLLVGSCMSHPWFKSRFPWEDKPDPNQKPVLSNSRGETYLPGTPSWVPLVDDCMAAGGIITTFTETKFAPTPLSIWYPYQTLGNSLEEQGPRFPKIYFRKQNWESCVR